MKSLNFPLSVMFTIALLLASAVLASNLSSNSEGNNTESATVSSSVQAPPRSTLDESRSSASALTLVVEGIRSAEGKVLVMVFDQEAAYAAYDYSKAAGYQEANAKQASLRFDFPSLTNGPYAIFVMHDENNDLQLNEVDGYPIEGFASSGASGKYDEPSFKQAAVAEGNYKLQLIYF